ncbi:MAG TPA: tetratricopeptide repeat protein [Flavobacteriales bacterium]
MPRVRSLPLAFITLGVLVLAACSTEKDAFLNRTFHSLVSRDNGWFNANERLKETVANMEKRHTDDFDQVLPVFIYGTEEAAKAMAPELEKSIEKCAIIVDRHSMEFGGKEKNAWVDDAYFVLGKCHFYKRSYFDAERTFDFTARRYKGQNRQFDAKLWHARTAIQLEQYAKAQSILDELRNAKELPKRFPHDELSAIQADLDLHRGKVDDGIVNLERAVQIAERKKDKVRWSFILAQLYQLKGQEDRAIEQYGRVARMNPPYEIGFHAQIFQALALDRGNSKGIRQKLNRMLRDDKHRDHFDMIHYALAELDLKENKDSSAIVQLRASTMASTVDTRQKAKSFLKLADLYFDDKQYPDAQLYYDSTATLMAPEHTRYEEVTVRAEVLGDLVEQLNIIAREDSLQAFAALDTDEQERRVRRLIRDRQEEEDAREAAEAEARELPPALPAPVPGGGGGGDAGAWYFYNPMQIARGTAEFKKKWGNRPNEDNWRRKDKSGGAVLDLTEGDPEVDPDAPVASKDGDEPEWKKPESYLKDIPRDSASLQASNERVCEALYLSGMIYKEKLKDTDNAIESFEVLNNRFDDCRYTPEAHYQMYRIYLQKEKSGNFMDFGGSSSQAYANIILERWPDSEFARLVRNPDQLQADEVRHQAEVAAYEQLYQRFRDGSYVPVITGAEEVITTQPDNHLLAKYHLLKAMAVGGLHEMTAFRNALNAVVTTFPGTDEAKAAVDILANLDRQGLQQQAPQRSGPSFAPDAGEHYVVLLYPNSAGQITQATAKISDFNTAHFRTTPFEIKTSVFDAENQVIMIRLFDTKAKAMAYYDAFLANGEMLQGINDRNFPLFPISKGNYQQFYTSKDLDAYVNFFSANYLNAK